MAAKDSNNGTEKKSGLVSTREACEILGMTNRGFRKKRQRQGPIPGQTVVNGQWAFPRAAIESMKDASDAEPHDALEEADELDIEASAAAMVREATVMVREAAKASKEVHATAALLMGAALDCVKGTDHRSEICNKQLQAQAEALGEAQKRASEVIASEA